MTQEMTLEQAVRKCKENGGRFCLKSAGYAKWYTVRKDGNVTMEEYEHELFKLSSSDILESKWIYEAPEQTAFGYWEDELEDVTKVTMHIDRKNTWNRALQIAGAVTYNIGGTQYVKLERIEKLKEP